MAKNINKDVVYKAAKLQDKDYKISLLVKTDGVKRWIFRYRFNGKPNELGFGEYPATTLENARRQAEVARQQIAEGIDPGEIRRQEKAAKQLSRQNQDRQKDGLPILDSFADVTRQWLASIAHLTTATTHAKKTSRIERLAFPLLGDKPIKEIKSADVLAAYSSEICHPFHGKAAT
jgi:hypothetical protein